MSKENFNFNKSYHQNLLKQGSGIIMNTGNTNSTLNKRKQNPDYRPMLLQQKPTENFKERKKEVILIKAMHT